MQTKAVTYVDFGYQHAREFWEEAGLPAFERFKASRSRSAAIESAWHAWHIHEWAWHELNRGQDTNRNNAYRQFKAKLIDECPELAWVQDIAEAGKHRGLGREDVQVGRATQKPNLITIGGQFITIGGELISMGSTLHIELTDGSSQDVSDVLAIVVAFWNAKLP